MHKILSRSGLLVKSVLAVLNSDAMFLKCFHHLITCTKCFEYLNSFLAVMGEILSEASDDAIIAFSEVYTKKQNVLVTCYHEQQNRVCCMERDDLIFFDLSAIENVAMRRFFYSSIHVNEYIKIYEEFCNIIIPLNVQGIRWFFIVVMSGKTFYFRMDNLGIFDFFQWYIWREKEMGQEKFGS